MKKLLILSLVSLMLFISCSSNNDVPESETNNAKSTTDYDAGNSPNTVENLNESSKQQPSSSISDSQAKEIALAQVPGGNITEFEYDEDESHPTYEITVTKDNYKYEIKIDALNGSILENEKEAIN